MNVNSVALRFRSQYQRLITFRRYGKGYAASSVGVLHAVAGVGLWQHHTRMHIRIAWMDLFGVCAARAEYYL